jgi:predicted Zn-dependent protease
VRPLPAPPTPRRAPFLTLVLALAGCAVNPATGQRELSLVGKDQEIAMGRSAAEDVKTSIGVVDAPELTAYVDRVGKDLAATSERPELPWSFNIVDDPAVNAFALPGGFIYVTRGILASFESEAELAGVVGHEIGHVTARHSVSQISRQQLQQLGLGLGMIFSKSVRDYGDLLSTGLGILNLKYSRDDETQADELGVRYMTRAHYDPEAMVHVMQMLEQVSKSAGKVPEWQLTHPYPENREAHIRDVIAKSGAPAGGETGHDALLDHLDGLVYGPDPREGYFHGARFVHPTLRFEVRFPDGWQGQNAPTLVGAVSPAQDAVVVLTPEDSASDPVAALRAFLTAEGVQGGAIQEGDAYGIPRARAPFTAQTSDGQVQGEVLFLRYGGTVYRMLGYSTPSHWGAYATAVGTALGSFAPLTDPAILGVQPWRLQVVKVPTAMTLSAFQQQYPSVIPMDELAQINRLEPDARVEAGARLKRVVGKPLP